MSGWSYSLIHAACNPLLASLAAKVVTKLGGPVKDRTLLYLSWPIGKEDMMRSPCSCDHDGHVLGSKKLPGQK